jgi:hypothetical protein
MSDIISYKGIDEADLVLALHNGTQAIGFGVRQNNPNLTIEDVRADLKAKDDSGWGKTKGEYAFDYYYGRPLKVTLNTEKKEIHRADLYDRDAGQGAAQRIVDSLRKGK